MTGAVGMEGATQDRAVQDVAVQDVAVQDVAVQDVAVQDGASMIEPVARPPVRRRIRPDSVWAEARKAWEGGETARSVARRYDIGVPALWKRREAEGWKRPDPEAGPVEPSEGWDAFAARELEAFEGRLEARGSWRQTLRR